MTEKFHWKTNNYDEKWLAEINGNAFSRQPSTTVFSQVYRNTFDQPDHFFILVGSDSGLLRRFLANKYSGQRRRYLFVEPDEIVPHIPNDECNEDYPIIPASQFNLESLSEQYPEYFTHNRFSIVRSLAVLDQIYPGYLSVWDEVQTQLKLLDFIQSNIFSNRKFIDTQLYNCGLNVYPAARLEAKLKGKSVILLGGGPTLDTGIEWIKQHREQILLAAVGRIAKRLFQEGIEPDIYASVDPNDVSYDNSKWLTQAEKAILIHTPYTHPALLAEYPGPRGFTDARFPWNTPLNPDNFQTTGPTVTNTLMGILVGLGAKHIYLLGVDFCYGPEGETHEQGSLEAKQAGLAHSTDLQLMTYSGRQAYTNTVFYDAWKTADYFTAQVHQHSVSRFFQLGQESARLTEVPLVDFEQITLNDAQEQKIVMTQAQTLLKTDIPAYQQELKQIERELKQKKALFKQIHDLAAQGKKTALVLFDNLDKLDSQTKKITKIQKKLNSDQLNWAHQFLYHYAVKNYAEFLSPTDNPPDQQTQEEIKQDLTNYFTALEQTSSDLMESLKKAIEHTRIISQSLSSDQLEPLARYWLSHNQEGRIRLWLQWRQKTVEDLSEEDRYWAQKLLQAYEQKLHNEQETLLAKRLRHNQESLNHQLKTLQHHFENRDKESIELLIPALEKIQTPRGQSAAALAKGYLNELKGDKGQALDYYLKVEEQDMMPNALSRVVQLALEQNNRKLALDALELLVQFNDQYLIAYADLLGALGDPAGAIQIYDHYLSDHLDDYSVWLKAAKAALQGGDQTAAEQCLNEVIQKSAEAALIKEAKTLLDQLHGDANING